ncbi:MAG: glutamine synthetase [Saprospiraceae bacterium]|nr:glutamine synthetase [Saprospiraceae bacterium]
MKKHGTISVETLRELVEANKIDTIVLGFTDHYGRMLGKRMDAEFFIENALEDGAHACDYLLTTDMEMEPVQGYAMANWNLGYGDFHLIPDLHTMRKASWLRKTAIITCDVYQNQRHELLGVAPRSILRNQLSQCADMGYSSMAASELEHYLFEQSFRECHEKNYHELKPVGWYLEDYHILQGTRTEFFHSAARKHLKKSGIPVETSKGEWGLGQHELNICYAETLEMADRHMVFKQCLKELADQMKISITFMAKYHADSAGSSCHLHISLWKEGKNAFIGNKRLGPIEASEEFQWFLGGWMKYVPDLMPFYAPTINSYKRYVDASWAPTRLAWSHDNRTAGFRVVGQGKSLRIECRIPGADCNPYLAFAASLASGLEGIRAQIEPPPIFSGDAYADESLQHVPKSLGEAANLFRNSAFTRKAFGDTVVDHYAHFFDEEVRAYEKGVTDWERKRYFERI